MLLLKMGVGTPKGVRKMGTDKVAYEPLTTAGFLITLFVGLLGIPASLWLLTTASDLSFVSNWDSWLLAGLGTLLCLVVCLQFVVLGLLVAYVVTKITETQPDSKLSECEDVSFWF
jgi:hypothetical protein